MPAKKEWVGNMFGRWTVTAKADNPRKVVVLCACGTTAEVAKSSLATGHSQSCGCLKREETSARFKKTPQQKLWDRVTVSQSDCWEWKGSLNASGYGTTGFNRSSQLAHRVAWMETNGPIPDGLFVLHRCDNRCCINPAHLWLGTNDDNMKDMARKGRSVSFWDTANEEQKAAKRKQIAEQGRKPKSDETKAKLSKLASNRRRVFRDDGTWFWGKADTK